MNMSNKHLIKNLLSQEAFFVVNKAVIRNYGLITAGVLASLCDKYTFHSNKGTLYQDEWFYHTREALEEELCMSPHEQRVGIEKLKELGILEVKRIGTPSKNYYRLNGQALFDTLNELK